MQMVSKNEVTMTCILKLAVIFLESIVNNLSIWTKRVKGGIVNYIMDKELHCTQFNWFSMPRCHGSCQWHFWISCKHWVSNWCSWHMHCYDSRCHQLQSTHNPKCRYGSVLIRAWISSIPILEGIFQERNFHNALP